MKYLLYNKCSEPTGPKLASELGIASGLDMVPDVDVLVRWGESKEIDYTPKLVVNHREALLDAIDKRRSLKLFNEYGLRAPFPEAWPTSLPAVGRGLKHQEGRGFWLCLQEADIISAKIGGADYFIPYIPTRNEYRVHIVGSRAILTQVKVLRKEKNSLWPWLRGNRTGWGFDPCAESAEATEIGMAAVSALRLDFGAVDIIEADYRAHYVLEVNTAPGLNIENLKIWADALKEEYNV